MWVVPDAKDTPGGMPQGIQPHQWWERRKRAFDRLMEARNVPPKRKEVAWRLCLGDSDKEIGHRFRLTRDGVTSHVRLLFPTFRVRDRRSFRRTVGEQMDRESPDQPPSFLCARIFLLLGGMEYGYRCWTGPGPACLTPFPRGVFRWHELLTCGC